MNETKEQNNSMDSRGYAHFLPEVSPWVIGLGWDHLGFEVRLDISVTLQVITRGELLTQKHLEGKLIHHGYPQPRNARIDYSYSCASHTTIEKSIQKVFKNTHREPRKFVMLVAETSKRDAASAPTSHSSVRSRLCGFLLLTVAASV